VTAVTDAGPAEPGAADPRTGPAGAGAARQRWPLRRVLGIGVLALLVVTVLAAVFGGLAVSGLAAARDRVVNQLDPASQQTLRLDAALLDQETGVRGYALSGQADFLQPYTDGIATGQDAANRLRTAVAGLPGPAAELTTLLDRVDTWRSGYATGLIDTVRASGKPVVSGNVDAGKADFDRVRSALTALQTELAAEHEQAVADLNGAVGRLVLVLVLIGVALLAVIVVLGFGVRAAVIRPIARLAGEVRQVSDGAFEHPVASSGPREVFELGGDVDRMRQRILRELAGVRAAHGDLDARTQELQRSNAELEQFAYVASHDLQEPLRKVASFCQLLQRRYGGQLDERADQYIEFAVDGAKRMQTLINDLLAFSRVGRITGDRVRVDATGLAEQAARNLTTRIEQAGATVEIRPLPAVDAEIALLTTVFQNLIGNALKFRSADPPHVVVDARRNGDEWEFSFADNGIGIDAQYADRIFVIFQRLHGKAEYPGTGIGLAMCRKIIEYHGGRIWLDTTVSAGSRFCFTLPAGESGDVIEENPDE
jgi:signal transduction histidine kinase